MDLNAAMIFVRVVRSGSFTEAARTLGLPKSTVSDKISELEKSLGVSLLIRTTRKLNLTEVGTEFFKKAETAVNSLLGAAEEASFSQKIPTGTLRITAPTSLAGSVISDAISEYKNKFPEVKIEIYFNDRYVDMVGDGFDIAVRAGLLNDSSLLAKRIGSNGLVLASSQKYLKNAPTLKQPSDLRLHKCIVYLSERDDVNETAWNLLSKHGKKIRVQPIPNIFSNSFREIGNLIMSGEGIALLPPTLFSKDFTEKKMIRVLPDWSTAESPTHLVYPPHKFSSPKVREMIPILEAHIRNIFK